MHLLRTSMRATSLVVGASLALALALPALANTGHQSGWNVDWNDEGFQGSASECEGAGLDAGDVLWHFVQTRVPAGVSSGMLTATFGQAGEIAVDSYKRSGGVLHWAIITGQDTVLTFSSDVTSDGQLNLSHICAAADGEESPEAPTDKPSQAPTTSQSQAPTDKPSQAPTDKPSQAPTDKPSQAPTDKPSQAPTDKPSQAPTDKPSQAPTDKPSQAPTDKPSQAPTDKPSQAPTDKPSQAPNTQDKPSDRPSTEPGTQAPTTSPTGESGGATGTPRVTPPPTDAIGGDTTGSGTGWLLAMIGLAALVVGLIVGMPSRRSRRQTPGR